MAIEALARAGLREPLGSDVVAKPIQSRYPVMSGVPSAGELLIDEAPAAPIAYVRCGLFFYPGTSASKSSGKLKLPNQLVLTLL
jgi:hypothetical protein